MSNPFKAIGSQVLSALIAALIPVLIKAFTEWLESLAEDEVAKIITDAVDKAVM